MFNEYEIELDLNVSKDFLKKVYISLFIIGNICLVTIPAKSPSFKIIRQSLILSGFMAGCKLLYDYRTKDKLEVEKELLEAKEQEIEATYQEKEQELETTYQQKESEIEELKLAHLREVEEVERRLQSWVDEQSKIWEEEFNSKVEIYESTILELKRQLLIANAPRRPYGNRAIDDHCNKIIDFLLERDIWVHCDVQPAETLSEEIFILTPQNPDATTKLKDLIEPLECLLNVNGSISIARDGRYIKITHYLRDLSPEKKAKMQKEKTENVLLTIDDCVDKNKGFFLCGDSGSGKTSSACYIAQKLANKQPSTKEQKDLINPNGAECIVLDLHNNPIWHELELQVIHEPEKILAQLNIIREEYVARKSGKKGNRLIVFLDEVGELLAEVSRIGDSAKEKKENHQLVVDTIQTLSSGGRKFYINLIAMNQSKNVSAIGIDGSYRNNFILVLLCAEARKYSELKWQQSDPRSVYVNATAYPAIVEGAMPTSLLKHPTHHAYKKMVDGDVPQNLEPIKQLPLSIALVK
jgi:hypothetical protein